MSVRDRAFLRLKVLGTTLSGDFEAKERRFEVMNFRSQHDTLGIHIEEREGESGAEIGSIKSMCALRDVHLLTLGAIDFDSILTKLVA